MTTAEPLVPETPRATRRITRAFLVCHGLRWLPIGFVIPILVLVPTQRGLALPTVGLMFAAYGLTTALLELPTGGLADTLGRRPVLLVATVADTGLLLSLGFGTTAWHFLAGAVVGGLGRALLTGPLESWYVDTVRVVDPATALRPGLSAAGFAEGIALATGALLSALLPTLGAGLPLDGPVSQLTLPVYGGLVAEVLSFSAVLVLVHESRPRVAGRWRASVRAVPAIVVEGLRAAAGARDLRRLFGAFVLAAIAYVGVEVLWQPRFTDLLGSASRATRTFGYVVVAMSLGAAAGAWLADRLPGAIARHAGRMAAVATALSAAALAGLAAAPTFAAASAAFVGVYALGALRSVAEAEMLHERVPAQRRATMVSAQSLTEQVGNVIASIALTRVAAAAGIPTAWVVGAVVLVAASVLLAFIGDE
ncbi:MAG TPA: MFS transporter [Euzebyales bacterium]|nr:MFS transporter [Euzebyales bacterium]